MNEEGKQAAEKPEMSITLSINKGVPTMTMDPANQAWWAVFGLLKWAQLEFEINYERRRLMDIEAQAQERSLNLVNPKGVKQ